LLAGGVEEDYGGVGVEFSFAPGDGVAEFGDLYFGVMGDAFDVIVEQGAGFGLARFSQHDQVNFH
jgi:hypothetical protein